MSMDPYTTHIKSIKDKLHDVVLSCTSFADNAYADYIKSVKKYPVAFIRLKSDKINDIGPAETHHLTTFVIQVENRSGYDEAALDLILGYAGEIVDAIEANRTLGSTHVSNAEITEVDYTLRNDREAVFHYAHITVVTSSLRNV